MTILILGLLYSAVFMLLMSTCIKPQVKTSYTVCKTICSIAFIGVAIYCAIVSGHSILFWQMLPALLLCLAGDVSLGVHKVKNDNRYFVAGLLIFLVGHICFLVAFNIRQPLDWIDFIFPILSIFLMLAFTHIPKLKMGRMKPAIFIYSFFVSAVFAKGIHLAVLYQNTSGYLLGVGTTLFLISDLLLLFLLFYEKKIHALHILNLVCYYYGMFFIACSLL